MSDLVTENGHSSTEQKKGLRRKRGKAWDKLGVTNREKKVASYRSKSYDCPTRSKESELPGGKEDSFTEKKRKRAVNGSARVGLKQWSRGRRWS